MQVSASFLGLLLAMVLLGPAPAALIGVLATSVDIARRRPRAAAAACNLAAWAWFALAGGVVIEQLAGAFDVAIDDVSFVLARVPGFVAATIVNFGVAAVSLRVLDGVSIRSQLRSVFVPLLPSEAAMVLLGAIMIYGYAHLGGVALGMVAALLVVYLWLLRALLLSQERAELLDGRTQQLAHTSGLLHDIGKFIFPDRILFAGTRPSQDEWAIIRSHPEHGAHVLRQIDGYGPVAEIVLCHHERIDGTGCPGAVSGDDIPLLSWMISIADTYDVMTARDSYRDPVAPSEAIAELRFDARVRDYARRPAVAV